MLLLQWRGPFVVERCGNGNNYGVEVNKRIKTYHVNMLKPYFERKSDVKSFGDTTTELEPKPPKPVLVLLGTIQGAIRSYMNVTATTINPVLMRNSC